MTIGGEEFSFSGIGRSVGKNQVQLKLFLARRSIRFRRIAFDEGEIFLFAHGKVSFDGLELRNRGEHDLRAYKISHLAGGDSGNTVDERTNIGELQIQFGLFQCSFIGLDGRFGSEIGLNIVVELALRNCFFFGQRSVALHIQLRLSKLRLSLCDLRLGLIHDCLKRPGIDLEKHLVLA